MALKLLIYLAQAVRIYQVKLESNPEGPSIWAMTRQTYPIAQLWDGIDATEPPSIQVEFTLVRFSSVRCMMNA